MCFWARMIIFCEKDFVTVSRVSSTFCTLGLILLICNETRNNETSASYTSTVKFGNKRHQDYLKWQLFNNKSGSPPFSGSSWQWAKAPGHQSSQCNEDDASKAQIINYDEHRKDSDEDVVDGFDVDVDVDHEDYLVHLHQVNDDEGMMWMLMMLMLLMKITLYISTRSSPSQSPSLAIL